MADQDIATKAPESDAQEDTEQAPTMTEHCTSDRPAPSGEVPTGEITKLNDVEVYIAKPADYPHTSAKLLLLLTGGTGIKSTNNQLQADKFAQEGFVVVMPDQFGGEAAPNATMPAPSQPNWIDSVKATLAEAAKSFAIDMWLARHTPEKVLPLLHKAIDGAKEEFADAIAYGGGIYGAGYCFGAKYILILAGEHADAAIHGQESKSEDVEKGAAAKEPLLKVGAVAHPTMVAKEDITAVKAPITMALVQNDPVFSEEVGKAGQEALEKNGVEHEIKTYSGVPHGFAVLGDYEESNIMEQQRLAYDQMLGWLQAH
ncbi:uncharacterized protein K452DRAFT_293923 [Aplosporella prunicola CBS 121167]|uniref:Dienelactone hydrolase domain-containing protein n=1 Tax=Aplosporella prunicola CBS 121167 TaxID=1176127 RepID=A0A6A6BXE7_9PEZI|nr:uncharacterized protein K452DRAFT_293923 [Aplosporella prunicola CBS 121167]KAF2147524.1 hypothetical protein K452DRAFT_293923 [Aplosporella prunicola CBS 121167]